MRRGDGWLPLSLVGAAGVTVVDAGLMERRFGVFRGGFLAPEHLGTAGQRASFMALSLLSDVVIVGTVAAIALWVGQRLGLATVARRALALVAGVAPLALADLFSYQLLAYLGDAFDLSLMFDLVGRQPRELIAVAAGHLAEPLWLIALSAAALAIVVWLLQRRFPDRSAPARRGPAVRAVLVLIVLGTAVVSAATSASPVLQQALRRKPSAQAITVGVITVSDLDRDGYGIGSRPPDPNQIDGAVRPYALDLPGDGIDQDGIGGDLPAGSAAYQDGSAAVPSFAWRPDVVLVLLESVRADVLEAEVQGRAATPVLRALAAAGGSAAGAYSHNGFTYQSRHHLFSGRLVGPPGGTTLLDDFKANGYRVGYVSGQDDGFGGPELKVNYERADVFFDARSAPERRYTQFSTPGSLAVPATVVLEQAKTFVGGTAPGTPMFLYVNFHDTHFPYHYAAIEPLLSRVVLAPGAIVPSRAGELREMYLNTMANVDRAIGELIAEVTRVRGQAPAVIVTSDHGESLFDEGFLGHGYALNEAQTRVPFIAAGLPLALPQPFAQADVRGAVQRALGSTQGERRPDFSAASTSPIFQYLGSIDQPRQIGVRSSRDRVVYDFRDDQVDVGGGGWRGPATLDAASRASWLGLVRMWERMMLARDKARSPVLE